MLQGSGDKTLTIFQKTGGYREVPLWTWKRNSGQDWIYGQVPLTSITKFKVVSKLWNFLFHTFGILVLNEQCRPSIHSFQLMVLLIRCKTSSAVPKRKLTNFFSLFQILIKAQKSREKDLIALTGIYVKEGLECKLRPLSAKRGNSLTCILPCIVTLCIVLC